MPDWEREAERRLEKTKFPAAGREEVARELAGYLDDLSCESRASGAGGVPRRSSFFARTTNPCETVARNQFSGFCAVSGGT